MTERIIQQIHFPVLTDKAALVSGFQHIMLLLLLIAVFIEFFSVTQMNPYMSDGQNDYCNNQKNVLPIYSEAQKAHDRQ